MRPARGGQWDGSVRAPRPTWLPARSNEEYSAEERKGIPDNGLGWVKGSGA